MDDAFDMLDRFADDGEPKSSKPTAKPVEAPKPPAPKLEEPKPGEDETPPETPPTEAPKPGEKPKASPWKLVEQYKTKLAQLEREAAELRTNPASHPHFKEVTAKAEAIAKRNEELENHIRYVDYSKSKEFTEQYQKPYEEAWAKAVGELKELTVETEDGMSRAATAQDMVALCNMPLKQARESAKAWFGDCADDVIAHRRQIRDLSEKQTKALENAKTMAGEREKQWSAEHQKADQQLQEEIGGIWKASNDEALAKFDFLKPQEGEPERNEKLDKAIKFVDEAFAASARDPRLTPQQRAEVVKKHAALRNRAIAYSPLLHENKKLRAQLEESKKALAAYQQSEPGKGNGTSNHEELPSGDLMGTALRSMDKYADRG